jgi:putative SOS response-associated peptidase YedK
VCNLYTQTAGPQAIIAAAKAMRSSVGNLAPGDVYPDYSAPIVRTGADGVRELVLARWGLPSPSKLLHEAATKRRLRLEAKGAAFDFAELLKMEPDRGVTNVRNTASPHWRRLLDPAYRCLVPFTAFSEPGQNARGEPRPVWFERRTDGAPLGFFAGIQTPGWQGVRKIKTGWEILDLFGFLTTEPSEPVRSVHPKAMPAILTEPDEIEAWMTEPWPQARALQRALPADALRIRAAEG